MMNPTETPSWRLIPFQSNPAALNMAIDESILEHISQNQSPPTIRFYGWTPSAVSIGYFQSLQKEVRVEACKEKKIDIVRRITGGGAVYHDTTREITYSLIAPESMFSKDILQSYHEICQPLLDGLSSLGIRAQFKPINDIIIGNQKVSGNAQTRRKGVLLQHGTILFDVDPEEMFSVLNVGEEKIKDKFIANVKERVTAVNLHSKKTKEECLQTLLDSFSKGKTIQEGKLSPSEESRAQELSLKKYGSKEWLEQR